MCDSGGDGFSFPLWLLLPSGPSLSAAFSKQGLLGEAGKRGRANVQREATGTALPLQQSWAETKHPEVNKQK